MKMKNDKLKKIPKKFKTGKETGNIAGPLQPNDPEAKFIGEEPRFDYDFSDNDRNVILARAFFWYNSFYTKKDAKELLCQYIDKDSNRHNRIELVKQLRKVSDSDYISTYGWIARMTFRGLVLNQNEHQVLEQEISRLVSLRNKPTIIEADTKPTESNRPNVQEILRERAREVAGDLEGMFDQFIIDGAKSLENVKIVEELTKNNIQHQHVPMLVENWERKKKEFEEVLKSSDKELIHAYSNFTKSQLKNCVRYCDSVLNDLGSYISLKKAEKAKPSKTPDQIVKGLKYMREFKQDDLDLKSIAPVKLHGCTEAYLYDTELRKLIYLVADSHVKTLSVKGTTILGFDTVKSQVKTIRKPAITVKEFMKLGKPAGRKFFEDIQTVGVVPKGRMNDRIIILKAW